MIQYKVAVISQMGRGLRKALVTRIHRIDRVMQKGEHPERRQGEVFISNFDYDKVDENGNTEWQNCGWQTKRKGSYAYDIAGNRLPTKYRLYPVFVQEYEIRANEHGEKILASLLPASATV